MNCNNKITKALIFNELPLLALSVVIIDGVYADATDVSILGNADVSTLGMVDVFKLEEADVSILGMVDVFKPEEADVFVVAET